MIKKDLCEINCIHVDIVEKVKKKNIPKEEANELAEMFKLLSNPTRIKILHVLSQSEMCVCDIVAVLGLNQSAVSHQLRLLRTSRLVKNRQEGKVVYYSLDDDHIEKLFTAGLEHVRHN
ncbi:MAG: ArsR family transcriptional regulator [Desulfitibacter sp. BRH_c19]|nr:MAG: ArsR family transcriptional regulator [Desulfitibacter sp. BRH_c19]